MNTNTLGSGSISVYDSIFRTVFTNEEIRAVFSDKAYISRCIEAEIALAKAEASLGVIPSDAAEQIAAGCQGATDQLDWERLQHDAEIVGYPILGLVRQLDKMCPGESGKYIHWGATTQDIMDTASILQIKHGLETISRQLNSVRAILVDLATKYRDTPMAGRTHLQHALPVTFGYKCAVWLSSLDRQDEHLKQLLPRVLLVQFGGAAGTLASLGTGDTGLKVRVKMAEVLGLHDPPISWHVARDGIAECISFLSILGGTLGKIALDLLLLSSSEFGEVQEPFVPHRGASSTMPQKRNSISSEVMLACSKLLRQHAATAQDAIVSDLERASGPWHLEWSCVPEAFCAASGALKQAEFVLSGLVVDTNRMLQNLDMSKGLIVGEAVMMGLAPAFGRNGAHDVVYEACRACIDEGNTSGAQGRLADKLKSNPQVTEKMEEEEIDRLCDPKNYLGSCALMVDQVVGKRSH
ncbi:L-Aspartase-like protein [Marasmius fiardii PR-910]|nr:L-Aspartase-like protein [Marasmius fiardii PR-910]